MKRDINDATSPREYNRSTSRNLPSNCMYCAYASSGSFSSNVCSTYCKKGCKPSMMQNPLKED